MSDVPTINMVDPVLYEGAYTADSRYSDRFVADSFRYRMRTSVVLGQLTGIVVIAVIAAVTVDVYDPMFRLYTGVLVLLLLVGFDAALTAVNYALRKRSARTTIPAGSPYRVTLRLNSLGLQDRLGRSEISYAMWRSASIVGQHLVLQRAHGGIYTLLPRQLFTPETEAWLVARVNGPAGASSS